MLRRLHRLYGTWQITLGGFEAKLFENYGALVRMVDGHAQTMSGI